MVGGHCRLEALQCWLETGVNSMWILDTGVNGWWRLDTGVRVETEVRVETGVNIDRYQWMVKVRDMSQ